MIQSMPQEILRHIVVFIKEPSSFRSWELSCVAMHSALDLEVEAKRTRERECIRHAWQQVQKHQSNTDNLIVEVLGVSRWNSLLEGAWDHFGTDSHRLLILRGDTSFVLAEIIQQFVIDQLHRANLILCGTHDSSRLNHHGPVLQVLPGVCPCGMEGYSPIHGDTVDTYPVLTGQHLLLQDALRGTSCTRQFAPMTGFSFIAADMLVFDFVWDSVINASVQLIEHAMMTLSSFAPVRDNRKKILAPGESSYYVATFSRDLGITCVGCGATVIISIPVPGLIQEAARALDLPRIHYDGGWNFVEGMTDEQKAAELKDVKAEYEQYDNEEGYLQRLLLDQDAEMEDTE